jgi:REP element-mobilizing transposase RayT
MNSKDSLNVSHALCRTCAKPQRPLVHKDCVFCRDIGFHEEILCDLNQNVQAAKVFKCHAFSPASRPAMSLVQSVETSADNQEEGPLVNDLRAQLNWDRLKYCRALAVQKLEREPDTVFVELKYHVAWNVAARKPIFVQPADALHTINDVFSTCGELVGGYASVLWLAPDHIHIYVESDGEKSVETLVRAMKRLSATALREKVDNRDGGLMKGRKIWDRAYFAETLG